MPVRSPSGNFEARRQIGEREERRDVHQEQVDAEELLQRLDASFDQDHRQGSLGMPWTAGISISNGMIMMLAAAILAAAAAFAAGNRDRRVSVDRQALARRRRSRWRWPRPRPSALPCGARPAPAPALRGRRRRARRRSARRCSSPGSARLMMPSATSCLISGVDSRVAVTRACTISVSEICATRTPLTVGSDRHRRSPSRPARSRRWA